jgi:hypothetical protein
VNHVNVTVPVNRHTYHTGSLGNLEKLILIAAAASFAGFHAAVLIASHI